MPSNMIMADKKCKIFHGDYDEWPSWKRAFLAMVTILKLTRVIKAARPPDEDFDAEADVAARVALVEDLHIRQLEWDEVNEQLAAWVVLSLGVVPPGSLPGGEVREPG